MCPCLQPERAETLDGAGCEIVAHTRNASESLQATLAQAQSTVAGHLLDMLLVLSNMRGKMQLSR